MARGPRQKSYSHTYHIIQRGINKQSIFIDTMDGYKFLKEIQRTKEKYKYELYAYCLMKNHFHLIIKSIDIQKIMHSISTAYSIYFNKKYNRIGHLFQNRYLSKAIETDSYLLNLQRYIHQNPEKSNICKTDKYKWSSYNDYIYKKGITDSNFILSIFDKEKEKAIKRFIDFNSTVINNLEVDKILDYEISTKLSDEHLESIIKNILNINHILEIQKFNKQIRKQKIEKLKLLKTIPKNQIARVMKLNIKEVQRVLKEN